uniref:t-SNARE coiled-coil homology domain-containing protein n=1 Tax=Brassica oleracea var. oleracea TaxID=109376 RepID=A0A0D3CHQ5_BRAOL
MSALASPSETIDDFVGHHGVSSVFSVRRNPKPIMEAERDSVGKSRRLLHLLSVKGLTTEELAARNDLVLALPARIEAIPDGTAGGPKSTSAWAPSTTSRPDIKFDSGDSKPNNLTPLMWILDGRFDDDYFQESHESRQEFEMRKIKQAGLDALKNMASDMNEELDRQVSLMDEIDSKVVNMASQFRAGEIVEVLFDHRLKFCMFD